MSNILLWLPLWGLLLLVILPERCGAAVSKSKKKIDPNEQYKGNTPFFLQDPYDQMCLGPNGFTVCDESALWILNRRSGKSSYSLVTLLNPAKQGLCLERKTTFFGLFNSDEVGIGSCSKKGSRFWNFDFKDQTHVMLSTNGQCLVRGKKLYKNSLSVQSCKKGEFIPLVYHPTAVHENGFYLKGADGTCFDGSTFRSCEGSGASKLLWGAGVKYVWGQAKRYFFSFNAHERDKCLVARGTKVEKGSCSDSHALNWALSRGQLAINNGRHCVARKNDNTAVMAKCKANYEFVTMEVPTVYTNEQLLEMLKNPNLSAEEKAALTEALQRKASMMA